jgi:hypothetical protein
MALEAAVTYESKEQVRRDSEKVACDIRNLTLKSCGSTGVEDGEGETVSYLHVQGESA